MNTIPMNPASVENQLQKLNAIQARWMALDINTDSKAKQREVCREMDSCPKNYMSVSSDYSKAQAMFSGSPSNIPMPVADVLKVYGDRLDKTFAWRGDGQWILISDIPKTL